jgi:hypothetical protein
LAKERERGEALELDKNNLAHEIGLLKDELSKEKLQRRQLEEALGSNQELEDEKKRFRKKIGELEQEIAIQLKNAGSAEASAQRHLKRCEELE